MPGVWPYWVDQGTGGTVLSNVTATVWQGWAGTGPVTITDPWAAWQGQTQNLAFGSVWVNWQTVSNGPTYLLGASLAVPSTPEETARHSLIQRQRSRAATLRRNIAGRKAEALLMTQLSEKQREEWLTERAFHVETADGLRTYRIEYGLAGNVRLVRCEGDPPVGKHGRPVRQGARFCMHVYHPDGAVPNQDNVLAQKLLIEANERHFLELANAA